MGTDTNSIDSDELSTANLRVTRLQALQPPSCVFEDLPGDVEVYTRVVDTRQVIDNMMAGCDDRLLVIVGLAEGHDIRALATALSGLSDKLATDLVLVLQCDQGMTHDPANDGSYHANRGIRASRELLLEINRLGLPTAVEFRDTITPQFFADLLSWASVSAQSEMLQELVSGLSMPVGLRSSATNTAAVLRALEISNGEHHFLGVSSEGVCGIVRSTGNPDALAILAAPAADPAAAAAVGAALGAVHRQRPEASLVIELSAEHLGPETLDTIVADQIGCGGAAGGAHHRRAPAFARRPRVRAARARAAPRPARPRRAA